MPTTATTHEPDICANRHRGNECSVAAGKQNKPHAAQQRAWVLAKVRESHPNGMTVDELAEMASRINGREVTPNRISGRVTELVASGELIRTTKRRPTRAGAMAFVHVARPVWQTPASLFGGGR